MRDWRPVPGFADTYASADGRVKGPSGKVLKDYVCPRGYHHVLIRSKKLPNHHAVLLAFGFSRPLDAECRHLDGDPGNNHLENLQWGSSAENAADRARHGNTYYGEELASSRLTLDQVAAIKTDTRPSRTVAREYGVSHTAVLNIRRGTTWSVPLARAA